MAGVTHSIAGAGLQSRDRDLTTAKVPLIGQRPVRILFGVAGHPVRAPHLSVVTLLEVTAHVVKRMHSALTAFKIWDLLNLQRAGHLHWSRFLATSALHRKSLMPGRDQTTAHAVQSIQKVCGLVSNVGSLRKTTFRGGTVLLYQYM